MIGSVFNIKQFYLKVNVKGYFSFHFVLQQPVFKIIHGFSLSSE